MNKNQPYPEEKAVSRKRSYSSTSLDITAIGQLSKDGVFIFDLESSAFHYTNEPFAEIFNTTVEKLLKDPRLPLGLIRSEDSHYLRNQYAELLNKKVLSGSEFLLQLPGGKLRHVNCEAYVTNESQSIIGFLKDITKEKEHEDFIIDFGAKKDTMLDMMSHNLSGPLTLSHNILSWMQNNQKDKVPQDISEQLVMIQENTQECLNIVNDFLKEEHLTSEGIYVKKTRFDIIKRIKETLDKLIATNKNKQFRLLTDLTEVNITTDSVKFFQIIHNLVSNSIKFTRENGKIDILVKETETSFIISVKDDGIGIPLALQPRLFEKRTPSGRPGLNKEASTGIGLSIVKNLVELIGGKVSFESAENKGSAFSIEIPKD